MLDRTPLDRKLLFGAWSFLLAFAAREDLGHGYFLFLIL
jgi:hypothetical protein